MPNVGKWAQFLPSTNGTSRAVEVGMTTFERFQANQKLEAELARERREMAKR